MIQKITIIEDEEILIELLKKKLEKIGYKVNIARDGVEGIESLKKDKPDLVLLDIVMPRLGGFGVMEGIKQDPGLKGIPIIIISNSGQPVELDKARELGARDWLIKTEFDPQEVVDKIKKLI